MARLSENVIPEDERFLTAGPTKYITETNRHPIHCGDCGELYYVDETIMLKVRSAHEGDPSEIAFCCDDCEEEYGEQEADR